jgi:hypothetical protein
VLLTFAGCAGSGGASRDQTGSGRPLPTASTSTVPAAGDGMAVIGPDRLAFTVRSCTDEPAADDRPQAHRVFLMEGGGTVDGTPFAVQAVRLTASGAGVERLTVTETVRITIGSGGAAKGIEAERSGVDPDWFDARDRTADRALLTNEGDVVRASGTFGPEGSTVGEPNVTAGTMVAHCPPG